jgi:flagellin-like protein
MDGMKANRSYKLKEDEAVSAVIGVILMVAITVAIAATVYVFLSSKLSEPSELTYITGIYQGHYDNGTEPLVISGKEYKVYATKNDLLYLNNFIGLETTFVFVVTDYRDYEYEFRGAYLSTPTISQ